MEEAVRAYGPAVDGKPAELAPMQRYPGQFAFVHERLEVMDAKLERVLHLLGKEDHKADLLANTLARRKR